MIRTKLPSHKHPLYPLPWVRRCDSCGRKGGYKKDGYHCYRCNWFFHKECAESSLEINHPSHPEHTLHLRLSDMNHYCGLCGRNGFGMFYYCSICNFAIDTTCARNPPPDVIEYPNACQHSLVLPKRWSLQICDVCKGFISHIKLHICLKCDLCFHFECLKIPLKINYPCHPKHSLKFLTYEEHHFSDGKCRICGEELGKRLYHCSICKFSVDVGCARDPPPLMILFAKAHEHQLSIMPRNISFNCDACGMTGDRSPYSCQQCDFMIHQSCINLPEIINVNRHDHRLSRRFHLDPGSWTCKVCYQKIDWSYGAYSCLICPNYAIHSRCAIQDDVWDKLELKGIPEETQELEPFKVINENLICHFSHENHYLKLYEENIVCGGRNRCEACVFPIYSQAFYRCEKCDFILHKKCAGLPRKKRILRYDKPLTLICGDTKIFICFMCSKFYSGFRFTDGYIDIDVNCGVLSETILHESHQCRLYYYFYSDTDEEKQICVGCNEWSPSIYRCDDCKFQIDPKCIFLPKTTSHWYDDHLLSLCYEKKNDEEYWCDICEKKIGTISWFYMCDKCCVTFHTRCVLGDFYLMPGRIITDNSIEYKVMQTSPGFIPRCYVCRSRRAVPIILKKIPCYLGEKAEFICSSGCLYRNDFYLKRTKVKDFYLKS